MEEGEAGGLEFAAARPQVVGRREVLIERLEGTGWEPPPVAHRRVLTVEEGEQGEQVSLQPAHRRSRWDNGTRLGQGRQVQHRGKRVAQVAGKHDGVEGPLAGAQVERVGQAIVDERGGGGGRGGPGGGWRLGGPWPVGVQGTETGRELGPREREAIRLGQCPERGAGVGIECGERLRQVSVDGGGQLLGHLLPGMAMMDGQAVDSSQGLQCAPGIAAQASSGIHVGASDLTNGARSIQWVRTEGKRCRMWHKTPE